MGTRDAGTSTGVLREQEDLKRGGQDGATRSSPRAETRWHFTFCISPVTGTSVTNLDAGRQSRILGRTRGRGHRQDVCMADTIKSVLAEAGKAVCRPQNPSWWMRLQDARRVYLTTYVHTNMYTMCYNRQPCECCCQNEK